MSFPRKSHFDSLTRGNLRPHEQDNSDRSIIFYNMIYLVGIKLGSTIIWPTHWMNSETNENDWKEFNKNARLLLKFSRSANDNVKR